MKTIRECALLSVVDAPYAERLAKILNETQILMLLNGVPTSTDVSLIKFKDAYKKNIDASVDVTEVINITTYSQEGRFTVYFKAVVTRWYGNPNFKGGWMPKKDETYSFEKKEEEERTTTIWYDEADKYGLIPVLI